MSDTPERLSDIDVNVHGFTADDVIANRKAAMDLVRRQAERGDSLALQTMWLDAQARAMGLNMDYAEELDEDDLS